MKFQFYPTPPSLAMKAVRKFNNKRVTRMLEPQAGRGDLVDVARNVLGNSWNEFPVDTIEIDFDNQAVLRQKKYRVVGHDFLQYRGAASYSHILCNPPFAEGVEHVLYAWNLLYHGELVAILNAESIRNPYTKERRILVDLIEQHGSVEYHRDAFMSPDTERKTEVEVAIVHLERVSQFKSEFLDKLKKEMNSNMEDELPDQQELIVANSKIENMVTAFQCAVAASKDAVFSTVRAKYYASMLGKSITDDTTGGDGDYYKEAAETMNKDYIELKERAWSSILRSSDVTARLSSGAQKRLEAEFTQVCDLEFTAQNIAAFLLGLVQQQGDIQKEMVCDVFDDISKYHHDNRAYYQGWKSNTKHRVNAFRILTTRIILPGRHRNYDSWSLSLEWHDAQRFRDFDKVFAMLDGKQEDSVYGITKLFSAKFDHLRAGERLSCEYFDIRFYKRAGTFHIYPRRKDLIDRLNRIVGKHRAWLPVDDTEASPAFWQQYNKAEAVTRNMELTKVNHWRLVNGDESDKEMEAEKILLAHNDALAALGIKYDANMALAKPANHEQPQLLLEMAS